MGGEVDSMIYFTSDLHFYHKNVIKHANGPYSDEDEMNKSKQVRGLPFDAVLPPVTKRDDFRSAFTALREEAADVPEMSLEEINAEISAARAERKRG